MMWLWSQHCANDIDVVVVPTLYVDVVVAVLAFYAKDGDVVPTLLC